jgi:putative hemolysin
MLLKPSETLTASERVYPTFAANLPPGEIARRALFKSLYLEPSDLEQILRLRFEVFNLELGEGLDSSFLTGLDRDEHDDTCHHLAAYAESGDAVGTYRIQTSAMAATSCGFYSAREFDLRSFPSQIIDQSVELGRACISPAHRNTRCSFFSGKASRPTFALTQSATCLAVVR